MLSTEIRRTANTYGVQTRSATARFRTSTLRSRLSAGALVRVLPRCRTGRNMPFGTLFGACFWPGCAFSLCLTLAGCETREEPEILVKVYAEPQELPSFLMPRPYPEPPMPDPKKYTWGRWLILIAAVPFLWAIKRLLFGRRRKKAVFTTKGKD